MHNSGGPNGPTARWQKLPISVAVEPVVLPRPVGARLWIIRPRAVGWFDALKTRFPAFSRGSRHFHNSGGPNGPAARGQKLPIGVAIEPNVLPRPVAAQLWIICPRAVGWFDSRKRGSRHFLGAPAISTIPVVPTDPQPVG